MSDQMPDNRFVRWQSRTIEQLGYAINLVLGLSVAALGFEVSLLLNPHFEPGLCWERMDLLLSLFSLCLSALFGAAAVVTRLLDFRGTAQTIRTNNAEEKKGLRARTKALGYFTWFCFWGQFGSFGVGIALAALRFATLAVDKLT